MNQKISEVVLDLLYAWEKFETGAFMRFKEHMTGSQLAGLLHSWAETLRDEEKAELLSLIDDQHGIGVGSLLAFLDKEKSSFQNLWPSIEQLLRVDYERLKRK